MVFDESEYLKIKVKSITGRYIAYDKVNSFLDGLPSSYKVKTIGNSVLGNEIKCVTIGSGPKRLLLWSQMHGNESTTTKAVLDILNYIQTGDELSQAIVNNCTLFIIPILNPDGALAYTRFNANLVDLNRDSQKRTEPESRVLREIYNEFKPSYCFNLHDQRTIFNVGKTKKPATVSFLSPAFNIERNLSFARESAMRIVAAMNEALQKLIPGQVGRFDDAFNPNCIGDALQMEGTPTILFEAGHYNDDYEREKTRELIFYAIVKALQTITYDESNKYSLEQYLNIPENNKMFCDVILKNTHLVNNNYFKDAFVKVQYKEILKNNAIIFKPYLLNEEEAKLVKFGHVVKDCKITEDLEWLKLKGIYSIIT